MKIAVYTITRNRLDMTRKSFKALRNWSGVEFDHFVFDNGSEDGTPEWLYEQQKKGRLAWVDARGVNYGQNIAANYLLDEMVGYDFIMRWDNDAMPRTRRFLKKLLRAAQQANEPVILSPKITMLKHEPPVLDLFRTGEFELEVVSILGGICRLHPAEFFEGWRFNKYGALGFGEANEVADRCTDLGMGMARVSGVEVEHTNGEDGQAKMWPEYFSFEQKEVSKYVGYGL